MPGKPMHCGRTFDDAERSLLCPHSPLNDPLKLNPLHSDLTELGSDLDAQLRAVTTTHADALLEVLKRRQRPTK